MAAPCSRLVRSAVEGFCYLSTRRLCLRTPLVPSPTCHRSQQCVLQHRPLHCSHYPLLSGAKAADAPTQTGEQKKTEEEDLEEDYGPEYIPKRKAKNPMMAVGYAWIIGLPMGVIGFILAKRQVDKNRLKQLKIRQRMKKANEGEYEHERYKAAAGME
ncbi:uncharacterized protein [Salminus brasiliensis]|uniref:uncharacterized protein n=1 Tax=Salminus brasiliensis TaxID=930266 RepID=UPI003B832BF8